MSPPLKRRPTTRACPLCGARFIADPDQPPVAHDRNTGKPVAICGRCVELVAIGRERQP